MTIRSVVRRLRNIVARALLSGAGIVSKDRLVPVDLVRAVRPLASGEDALVPPARPILGQDLADPFLARHLRGRTIGTWTLGPESLAFVQSLVMRHRPRLAIEFGSGISTVALAVAMRDAGAGLARPSVVSIEQDEAQAEQTRDLLRQVGVADEVTIVVAPLERQRIEGVLTICYSIPAGLEALIGDRYADLILVDGPAAEAGARFGTLPLVRRFVRGDAHFVLDDALRDGELAIARRWASLPYVEIEGIRLIEKGLLTGTIRG